MGSNWGGLSDSKTRKTYEPGSWGYHILVELCYAAVIAAGAYPIYLLTVAE